MDGTGKHHLKWAQKAKNHMFFPYVDYRHKINVVILLDMGHTLRGDCAQEA
jgi:hypothetical protein